jgi:subtilisin-like proprotein convertase family protein
VLHNHSIPDPLRVTNVELQTSSGQLENFGRYAAIYDDSGSGGILASQPSDGPGSLNDFAGQTASGVWLFSVIDNALTGEPGYIDRVDMRLDVTSPNGILNQQVTILPNRFERNVVRVPPGATSLDVTMSLNGPINLYIRRGDIPTPTEFDKQALIDPPGGSLSLGVNDIPPLSPGIYHLLFVNPSGANVDLTYSVDVEVDAATIEEQVFESLDTVKILADQARTTSTIFVDEDRILSDIKAAVRIDHPRVSDLAIRLVGPDGQKILLSEHRGGEAQTGYGDGSFNEGIIFTGFTMNTNLSQGPIKFAAPPYTAQGVSTNVVETDFEDIEPRLYVQDEFVDGVDGWEVLRDDVEVVNDTAGAFNGDQYLLLNNGRIRLPVPTFPGLQYELQFAYRSSVQDEQARLILELPNGLVIFPGSDTLEWQEIDPAVFTAQSNAGVFIEVAGLPENAFMAVDYFRIRAIGGIVYYTPEESLNEFLESGISSLGQWQLEVDDEREGALGGEGLLSWQLRLGYAPLPIDGIELFAGTMIEGTLDGAETHYYYIDTPRSATTAINNLTGLTGAAEMLLRADRRGFPVGNPSNDEYSPVFTPDGGGSALLLMNDDPPPNTPLIPGQRYFLAVENVDTATTNSYSLEVTFDATDPNEVDVPEITLGTPVTSDVVAGLGMDYYKVRISDEATEATFELTDLSGDADLYIRRATDSITPLPTILDFDWAGIQSGLQDETLQLTLQSQPPLDPGLWYIGVLNNEIQPITYTLTVNEVLPDPVAAPLATPTLVNGNTALLTWESVAGQTYVVETSSDLITWSEMSVTTATGQTSTASESIADFIASGTGARFYRVRLIGAGQQ